MIVIIGGGPAGMLAAIAAGKTLSSVKGKILLLEANSECGVKLLLSGSGQCNYTHNLPHSEILRHCHEYANNLKPAYYAFDNSAFTKLLRDNGVESTIRPDNKVFPASLQARDVRDALLRQLAAAGVQLRFNAKVEAVSKHTGSGFKLSLQNGETLDCNKLIISTGGASYPVTGSDGFALRFAKALGHQPLPFKPHLSSVVLQDFDSYSSCAGISIPSATLKFISSAGSFTAQGDLLFTHTGFSGPVILDNSYRLDKGGIVSLRLVPDAEKFVAKLKLSAGKQSVFNALHPAGIPARLLNIMLERAGVPADIAVGELRKDMLKALISLLGDCRFSIAKVHGLNSAMASAGGVSLKEVNAKSMESRLCEGLYFAGEILDYALPTGGFNIQIAASTGWLAGCSAARNYLK